MRPCKVYAKALDTIRGMSGDITPDQLRDACGIDKKRSWWSLQLAVRNGIIQHISYGIYRRTKVA